MRAIPFLLNRLAGPFFTGGLMAAAASTGDPVSGVALAGLACVCGFVSLPGKDQLIARALHTST